MLVNSKILCNVLKIRQLGGRQSNYEALRLLCMLMVLNLHSFSGYQNGYGLCQALDFFRESTSICAVDCFLLISGYFGIKWKLKSFFNLIFQLFFYSVGIYLVCVAVGIVEWSRHDFITRFACLYENSWGFAVGYVMLYFCAPLLNTFVDKVSEKSLLVYIVILFMATNFICLSVESNRLFTYSLLYLIGRYISKADLSGKINFSPHLAYWISTALIFILVYVFLFMIVGIRESVTVLKAPLISFIGYNYSAPLVIFQAVFLFLAFSKLSFSSKVLNWMASSCFAIYLIHMHPTIKEIGYRSYTRGLYELDFFSHVLILLVLIIAVAMLSILIDKIRVMVSDFTFKQISKMLPEETLVKQWP